MHIFYAPDITGTSYTLDEKESKHSIRVLRMTRGTAVRLIDGKGNLYEGMIDNPDQTRCIIRITGLTSDFEKRSYRLHIAISPLKNPERFEWFIEKCVEIGIDEITPLICRNSEKTLIKTDRLNNIIVSAMKQSVKPLRPLLHEPMRFEDFTGCEFKGKKLIAHCNIAFERKQIAEFYSKGDDAVLLIGPEGDFSSDEISAAISCGFNSIHLGQSRLRTETAGITACHSVYFMNQ